MTRYRDVSEELARQVTAGELAPGDELPSVRDLARAHDTTASTVSRAYRHLADGGVVSLGERRRARIATDAPVAARRLLGVDRVFRLAGSDDPALDLLLRRAGRGVVRTGAAGSFQGLTALWRGSADGAAVHLLHRSGAYNTPFAAALLRGRGAALISLWRREQGLLLPAGNPRGVAGPGDLIGLRVARREFGSGTRVLHDRLLTGAGADPDAVAGPECAAHLELALAVASGMADTALGVRAAATALDLDFVPLVWERFDLVLDVDALGAAAPVIDALRDSGVRADIRALGGYDLDGAGDVRQLG